MMSANGYHDNSTLLNQNPREHETAQNRLSTTTTSGTQMSTTANTYSFVQTRSLANGVKSPSPQDRALILDQQQYLTSNDIQVDADQHRRLECSSNQFGSDSGLGLTYSNSSDNNSCAVNAHDATTTRPASTRSGLDQDNEQLSKSANTLDATCAKNKLANNHDNQSVKIDSMIEPNRQTSKIFPTSSVINNNSNKNLSNNDLDCNRHNKISTSSKTTSQPVLTSEIEHRRNQDNNIQSKHGHGSPSNTRAIPTHKASCQEGTFDPDSIGSDDSEVRTSMTSNKTGPKSIDSPAFTTASDRGPSCNNARAESDACVSAKLKGKANHAEQSLQNEQFANKLLVPRSALKRRSDNSNRDKKASRNVTFNQTVIVFCEEIETSPPSEPCDPPLGYQDSDHPPNTDTLLSRRDKGALSLHDFLLHKIAGQDTSKLTDEQLFALFGNGALLDEVQSDEYSDENESTIDRLRSDQSYLCQHALSDSDESEPSTAFDTNEPAQPNVCLKTDRADTALEGTNKANQPVAAGAKKDLLIHRSLPARMKVSTVDNPISRRRASTSRNDLQHSNQQVSENAKVCPPKQINSSNNEDSATRSVVKPLTIQQTNVEPATISKSTLVNNNAINRAEDVRNSSQIEDKKMQSTTKFDGSSSHSLSSSIIIRSPGRQVTGPERGSVQTQVFSDPMQSEHRYLASNSNKPNVESRNAQNNQPACHVCMAIESQQSQAVQLQAMQHQIRCAPTSADAQSKSQQLTTEPQTVANHSQNSQTYLQKPVAQNKFTPQPSSQPVQACISCHNLSTSQQGTTIQPQPMYTSVPNPVSYRILYILDQNGNRIRAFQVDQVTLDQQSVRLDSALRQILVPKDDRQSRDNSTLSSNQARNPNQQAIQNQLSVTQGSAIVSNAPRVVLTQQPQPFVGRFQLNQQAVPNTCSDFVVPVSINSGSDQAARHHTIYYVRQPLGAQNLRRSFDMVDSPKAFPDPQEVRRLDGIRGPTTDMHIAQREQLSASSTASHIVHNESSNQRKREDLDDPTFGFSKRPSVKVFQANNNISNVNSHIRTPKDVTSGMMLPKGESKLNSINFGDSQTLDRRGFNINHHHDHLDRTKQNSIPSTSSMSNLSRTATSTLPSSQNRGSIVPLQAKLIDRNTTLSKDAHQETHVLSKVGVRVLDNLNQDHQTCVRSKF